MLSRGGVPLPDRACGAGPGSSIQGRVLVLLLVSVVWNNGARFLIQAKVRLFSILQVSHFLLDVAITSLVDFSV